MQTKLAQQTFCHSRKLTGVSMSAVFHLEEVLLLPVLVTVSRTLHGTDPSLLLVM